MDFFPLLDYKLCDSRNSIYLSLQHIFTMTYKAFRHLPPSPYVFVGRGMEKSGLEINILIKIQKKKVIEFL